MRNRFPDPKSGFSQTCLIFMVFQNNYGGDSQISFQTCFFFGSSSRRNSGCDNSYCGQGFCHFFFIFYKWYDVASKGACGHDVRGRESIENRRLCEKGMTRHF